MYSASSHSESQSIEISTHGSRVLSRPSGNSMSVAVVLSTSALGDSETVDALIGMRSFFNVDSIVMARRLVEVMKNYFIPSEYELHVPLSGKRPYDTFPCGFGLSIDAFEAGLRFSFPTEWTSQTVSRSLPVLSADEIELVEILRGILSISRGVKDMNEAWLVEAGLSLALGAGDARVSTVEKCLSSGAEAGLRKRLRKVATEQSADASGSTVSTSADKGKGTVELGKVLEWGYTMRELCEVEDRAGVDRYFASIMMQLKCIEGEDPLVPRWSTISGSSPFWIEGPLSAEYLRVPLHPTLAKQVYECSSEELMNRAGKSVVWGLHFISALIDRVHDAGRLVRSQHEKILAFRAMNKELKASIGQELAVGAERRVKELEADIKRMQTELESLMSQRREFE
ncbi:hypothetical protein BHM03_00036066 [Ensete ventricosum]|nr:hypothetical protein BHM03_00036066 [Ensete ventricosum]